MWLTSCLTAGYGRPAVRHTADMEPHGIGAMAILLFSGHVAISILVALPALYSAYAQLNDVPGILNGNDWTE